MELKGLRNAKQMNELVEERKKYKEEMEMSQLLIKHNRDLSIINELVYSKAMDAETSVKVYFKDLEDAKTVEQLKELALCLSFRGYNYGYLNGQGTRLRENDTIWGLVVLWGDKSR